MRILLVSHGLPPDSVGGVEQHVDGLARALVAAGHEVEIFARSHLPGTKQGEWTTLPGDAPRIHRVAYRWENVHTLADIYRSQDPDELKRSRKQAATAALRQELETLKQERWGGFSGYDAWVLNANNASFAVQAAYDDLVPAFERLFEREGRDFNRFYAAVRALAVGAGVHDQGVQVHAHQRVDGVDQGHRIGPALVGRHRRRQDRGDVGR